MWGMSHLTGYNYTLKVLEDEGQHSQQLPQSFKTKVGKLFLKRVDTKIAFSY